jgi:2-polyprenyl-3-methyl-5-hydroxy-6-metoxy-1,4-benzoquinol methylase
MAFPSHIDILDIGSGTGGNIDMLKKFGSVTGLESNDIAIQLFKEKTDATVIKGTLPDLPKINEKFDLIVLFDVLEHIDDDVLTLYNLSSLLKPSGRILLSTPACPNLFGPHDMQHHHKRRYTKHQLSNVIRNSDLNILHINHFNTLLFPIAWINRIIQKKFNFNGSMNISSNFLNNFFKSVFSFEKHIILKLPLLYGLSLFAICEKGDI